MSERSPRVPRPDRDAAPPPGKPPKSAERADGLSNQAIQAETKSGAARLGIPAGEIDVDRHSAASFGARGAASAGRVSLGPDADRLTLAHELIHVAQARRFGTGSAAASRPSDPAEKEARNLAPQLLETGGSVEVSERPDARWNLDPPSAATGEEPAQVDPGWSFDPYSEDVVDLSNQDLVLRTLAVREWLGNHSIMELDYEAHLILQDRLDLERDFRIDLGHLWLEDIEQGATLALIRLMPGANGALDVVSVTDAGLLDTPGDLGGQPIMSLGQFNEFMARNGIGQISFEEYMRDAALARFAATEDFVPPPPGTDQGGRGAAEVQFGSGDLDALYGLNAALPLLSPRDTRLSAAFANQNAAGRQGALSELYFGTSPQALYGFGVVDQNSILASHPRTDFRMLFGDRLDLSLKSRIPDTAASLSPGLIEQYHNYLEGHAKLLGTQPGYTGFDRFMQVSARGRTPAQVRAQSGLMVDANDFEGYRALIADPLSNSRGASDTANYHRAAISRIYDGILQDRPIAVGDGGPEIRTVADLDAALESGRIGLMQHTMWINGVAADAASQVRPNADFGATQARNFQQAFAAMHPSLRPEPPDGPAQRFTATRRSGTELSRSASRIDQFSSYLSSQAAALSQGGQLLHIDPADVNAYQGLLREPFAREATPTGGDSRLRNYQRAGIKAVYDGVLSRTPVAAQSGETFRSVADLDAALQAGRLTAREHYQLLDRTGRMAARTIVPDMPAAPSHAQAQYAADRARANDYIRRAASPEYMQSVSQGGGWRGDAHAATRYGGRGALISAMFGIGRQAWNDRDRDFGDADTWNDIGMAGTREALRGGTSSAIETIAASRTSQYLLREGLEVSAGKALAVRVGSRALPGVVDVGFEFYDMATDDRENSGAEIGYRSTRALVIGGASAAAGFYAGAATGAAIGSVVPGVGTAIGFIVGLGVGLALSGVIPSWDDLTGPSDPSHDAFHDSYGNRLMFRSEYNKWLAEGRCVPGHHQRISVMEDPPGFEDRPSLFQMAPYVGQQDPSGDAARPQQPVPWQMSEADRKAITEWIESAQQGPAR